MSAATKARRGKRGSARRNDRPQPCQRCRVRIVWAVVEDSTGHIRRRSDDPTRLAFVPLNAAPNPHGPYAYVRGPAGRPVVRELDELERLRWRETDRYTRHYDTVRQEDR